MAGSSKLKKTTIYCYQGKTLFFSINCKQTDGSAFSIVDFILRMQVRKKYSDEEPVLDLDNDELGGITITNGAGGIATIRVEADDTAALEIDLETSPTIPPSEIWYFDIEGEDTDGRVYPLFIGDFVVIAEVTK